MKLKEWNPIQNSGFDFSNTRIDKYMELEIVKECSSVDFSKDSDEQFNAYIKELNTNAPFKTHHTYSFVVLKNGYAVGWNENPSRGWSFPIVKYKGKI